MIKNVQIKAKDIKENVSIADLLARLGFQPKRSIGKEMFYYSMLRDGDNTPSFTVDDKLGVWFDHGMGKGGNVIDFAMLFWKNLSFQEVLERIVTVVNMEIIANSQVNENRRKRSAVKIPNYEIEDIKDLGNNPAITDYLVSRCIWQEAQNDIKEVYYYVEDQKKLRKHFFSAGWKNELGVWEVRNQHFKGSLGHKAISFIPGDENIVSVFEGYMDYLSWKAENLFIGDSVIVLNSTNLIQSGIAKAKDFQTISIFFDRDQTGHQATKDFIKALPQACDCSSVYTGHNDYNEKLTAESRSVCISR
ncbi:toprim domain-containing protein [Mucilaginibacter sp. X5P1]|uniref:toprim domain-containing protein n=1 Tax=Mucilaginibacter sp. X5P1 TaxID=2723088 RepID=UPI001614718F|nr:toprim domain-containing protein [Mucilaginibacter sp. X5P1]MBB6141680.1 DNA primase [Mucilaginibacter sp. X5P1]